MFILQVPLSYLHLSPRPFPPGDLHFYMRHSLTKTVESEHSETEQVSSGLDPSLPEESAYDVCSLDPEHLIIQGTGGAFLHPTHVFSGAKLPGQLIPDTSTPSDPESSYAGEYVCKASYPSPQRSLELGKDNLSRFRSMVPLPLNALPAMYFTEYTV